MLETIHTPYRVYSIKVDIDLEKAGCQHKIAVTSLTLPAYPVGSYTDETNTYDEFKFIIEPPSEELIQEAEKILTQMGDSLRYAAFESSYSPEHGVVKWVQSYLLRYLPKRVPLLAKSQDRQLKVVVMDLAEHRHEPVIEVEIETYSVQGGGTEDEEVAIKGQIPILIYTEETYVLVHDE